MQSNYFNPYMEKFDSTIHNNLIGDLPFSYMSTNLYLDYCAYVLKLNGESLIVTQSLVYPHEFPSLFLPKNKQNWVNSSVLFTTESDVDSVSDEKIQIIMKEPTGTEFYYKTADFTNPKGSFGRRVSSFTNNYKHNLKFTYDKDKILEFYDFWEKQREHGGIVFSASKQFFIFCLNNLEKYQVRQVYVEVDSVLVGFAWGIKHESGNWVGLHLKANYEYRGLSRFIISERAKLFEESGEFSLGTEADEKGIEQYKEELGPFKKVKYSYILTGDK